MMDMVIQNECTICGKTTVMWFEVTEFREYCPEHIIDGIKQLEIDNEVR